MLLELYTAALANEERLVAVVRDAEAEYERFLEEFPAPPMHVSSSRHSSKVAAAMAAAQRESWDVAARILKRDRRRARQSRDQCFAASQRLWLGMGGGGELVTAACRLEQMLTGQASEE